MSSGNHSRLLAHAVIHFQCCKPFNGYKTTPFGKLRTGSASSLVRRYILSPSNHSRLNRACGYPFFYVFMVLSEEELRVDCCDTRFPIGHSEYLLGYGANFAAINFFVI